MGLRELEPFLVATRLLMGILLVVHPTAGGRLWFGRTLAPEPAARWLGIRDLALALTLRDALRGSPGRRTIFTEAALVDVGDALIAIRARQRLRGSGWLLIAAGAGAMAVADTALALAARPAPETGREGA
jgi:hypothetical protein